jgi:putative tryptophan/tyrosine transport system substrate-binding protein
MIAASIIPVVFSIGTDPVKFGLVQSLNKPGANVTGFMLPTVGLGLKRLQVLRELLPKQAIIGLLVNPSNPAAMGETNTLVEFTKRDQLDLRVFKVGTGEAIENAFVIAGEQKVSGILIESEPFLTSRRDQIVRLAAQHKIPVIDAYREFVDAGGLVSYGGSVRDTERDLGSYVGRILNGEKPADLPVQQSTKVELILNLRVARELGLTIPLNLLARADEVIE